MPFRNLEGHEKETWIFDTIYFNSRVIADIRNFTQTVIIKRNSALVTVLCGFQESTDYFQFVLMLLIR